MDIIQTIWDDENSVQILTKDFDQKLELNVNILSNFQAVFICGRSVNHMSKAFRSIFFSVQHNNVATKMLLR